MSIVKIIFIGIALLLGACGAPVDIPTTKLKNTPETKKMLTDFAKQQHRFEFSGCEMKYNAKTFNLEMSIQQLNGVFGSAYRELAANPKDKNNAYLWFDDIIRILENKKTKNINSITIWLSEISTQHSPFYILVEGVPLNNSMTMDDFIESSSYNYDDFYIDSSSYEIFFRKCDNPISYYFSSKVHFSYIGNGHMRLKDKPNFETTYPARSFGVYPYKK